MKAMSKRLGELYDEAGAEVPEMRVGDGGTGADCGGADGGQGAIAYLEDTPIEALVEGAVDATGEDASGAGDTKAVSGGAGGACADGGLSVGFIGSREG
jgi:hypothetical protein